MYLEQKKGMVWKNEKNGNRTRKKRMGKRVVAELRAPLQCTGQAKYTSDFTAGKTTNLLHAVAVQSTRALATVTGIDATVATQFDGVMAVI